jgi:hypothetical protein
MPDVIHPIDEEGRAESEVLSFSLPLKGKRLNHFFIGKIVKSQTIGS